MISILDKYIFKEFFKYFLGTLALLTGIGIIAKIMERLSVLIEYTGPFFEIIRFIYLNVPYIVTIVGPTALMFAISFTISNFSNKKELAVIMSSGRSFRRILSPVIIFAFIYSIFSFYLTEYVSYPWFLKSFDHYYEVLIHQNFSRKSTRSNYHAKINNRFLYIGSYSEEYNLITSLNVVEFEDDSPRTVIKSKFAIVIPGKWVLIDGITTTFNADNSLKDQTFFGSRIIDIAEGKNFLITHAHSFEEKSLFQLEKDVEVRKKHGEYYRKHLVELYWHYSVPFVSLFIVMIAGIMGSQAKKGAMSMSIAISTAITLVYYLLMYIGKSLAVNETFHPIFGAWFANIIFSILSVYLYRRFRV